ncbi:hypothetical protein EDD99_2699 [Streptomyces sp. 846.5]|nr:DUF6317 family protein [Streptomyces sp. 846.5]TDU04243.1 hypothetical protein EDD99_2699 [Streptomyces sp. 846.5]
MGSGYQVVLGDLQRMADTYHSEADAYRGLKPQVAPAVADGGDTGLNDSIQLIMAAIDSIHTKLADRIEEHGDKLAYVHGSYQRRDVDVHGAFEDLMAE